MKKGSKHSEAAKLKMRTAHAAREKRFAANRKKLGVSMSPARFANAQRRLARR